MKKAYYYWLLAGLLTVLPCAALPASAWEFSMGGAWTWEYERAGQLGENGLFGPHDADASNTGRNNLNSYLGYQWADQVVSSHAAVWATQYAAVDMTIKINKALKIDGSYYIGSWSNGGGAAFGVPAASEYLTKTINGIQQSFSPGYWNYLRIKAELPWGSLSFGKRPGRAGCGLLWNGDENTTSESVSLGAKYGPIRVGWSFYPARTGDEGYYNIVDTSNQRRLEVSQSITYTAGPIHTGYRVALVSRYRGNERADGPVVPADGSTARDRNDFYWAAWILYNNGRFFFNTEYDFYDRIDRHPGFDGEGNPRRTEYREHRGWMVETGAYAGPAKISLLAARTTGRERRGGVAYDKDGRDPSDNKSNTGVFQPYSYLMMYSYGMGEPANPQTLNGEMIGAMFYGARLDYSMAANLNLFGTFVYATRPDKGYGWGFLRPDPTAGATYGSIIRGSFNAPFWTGGNPAPAIPDDYLGYEIDAGFDWMLLEGYIVTVIGAYWQPGDWWKFACVSKTNPNWINPAADTRFFGTDPDRSLDPIYGLRILVNAEF